MSFAIRALVLLAATAPLFVATGFRAPWWQILLAAMLGSAVGHLAVRATRGHRVAQWSVAAGAAVIVALAATWPFIHAAGDHESSGKALLIVRSSTERKTSLTWDDVRAIKSEISSIEFAVPYLRNRVQVTTAEANWNTPVVGTTPEYFDLMALRISAGDRFDDAASSAVSKVVVLGETVVRQLFGAGQNPVGEMVRIKNMPFTIIGVLAYQGMSAEGQDLDEVAVIPIETYAAKIDVTSRFNGSLLISPSSRGDMARVEGEVRNLLRERHLLAPGDDDDFIIRHYRP